MKDRRLLTLFITIFIDLLGFGIILPILPNLTKDIAMHDTGWFSPDVTVGIIGGVFSLMQFIFSPFWGSVSDRVGRRPIILGSIIITGLGYLLLGFSNSILLLMIARTVAGIGSANISAAQSYIADITAPEDRAKKMGLIGAAFGMGFVFGPPLGGFLYQLGQENWHLGHSVLVDNAVVFPEGGLRLVGYALAIMCAINFVLAFFVLPESLTEKNADHRKFFKSFQGFADVWKIEVVGELFIISFIFITAFSMMTINSAVLWKEKYMLSPKVIGYIFGFIGICSAIIQGGLIGFFQRKMGLKKMLVYGCFSVAIGLTIIPLPSLKWFFLIQGLAILFITVGNGFLSPAINAFVSINTPAEDQGKTLGLLQGVSSLARTIGQLISGFLYSYYVPLPYLGGGLLMLIAFWISLRLVRQLKEVKPEAEIQTETTE